MHKKIYDERKKKVLLIAYAFPPHSVVGSMRPLRICKYLSKFSDWQPVILTVKKKFQRSDNTLINEIPKDISVEYIPIIDPSELMEDLSKKVKKIIVKRKNINSPSDGLPVEKNNKNKKQTNFQRLKNTILGIVSTPDHAVFWNFFVFFGVLKIWRKYKPKVIMVTAPPWSIFISGSILARLLKVPWIADLRDPWTDFKKVEKPRFLEKFELWLEKILYYNADAIISTSETYTNDLKKKYFFYKPEKFIALQNGYDEKKIEKIESGAFKKFTIVHLGSLYSWMNPHLFFEAFANWAFSKKEIKNNVQIIFVGEIEQKTKEVLEELSLKNNVLITGFVKHEEAIRLCKAADLLLLLTGTSVKTPNGWLPSKIFEYIGCNRPILANIIEGEAAKLIRKTESGQVITSDNKKAIIKILDSMYIEKNESVSKKIAWKSNDYYTNEIKQEFLMKKLGKILTCVSNGY